MPKRYVARFDQLSGNEVSNLWSPLCHLVTQSHPCRLDSGFLVLVFTSLSRKYSSQIMSCHIFRERVVQFLRSTFVMFLLLIYVFIIDVCFIIVDAEEICWK